MNYPNNPETHDIDEYKKVIDSEKSRIQFLIENCDAKFWEEDLNEQGQGFASFAYDAYLNNLEAVLRHKPFVNKYNQQDLQCVSQYLDKVYVDYLAKPPMDSITKTRFNYRSKRFLLKESIAYVSSSFCNESSINKRKK